MIFLTHGLLGLWENTAMLSGAEGEWSLRLVSVRIPMACVACLSTLAFAAEPEDHWSDGLRHGRRKWAAESGATLPISRKSKARKEDMLFIKDLTEKGILKQAKITF